MLRAAQSGFVVGLGRLVPSACLSRCPHRISRRSVPAHHSEAVALMQRLVLLGHRTTPAVHGHKTPSSLKVDIQRYAVPFSTDTSEHTPSNVKLLLPPRHSRGVSLWMLGEFPVPLELGAGDVLGIEITLDAALGGGAHFSAQHRVVQQAIYCCGKGFRVLWWHV